MNSSAESDCTIENAVVEMDCLTSWGDHGMAGTALGIKLIVHYRRKVGRPLCGDRILVDHLQPQPAVLTIQPQLSRFARADHQGRPQWIAANMDQAAIIVAAEPAPSRDLVDRYLVACERLHIAPLLILHKSDLGHGPVDALRQRLQCYAALGYEVMEISSITGQGVAALSERLRGHRTLLTGQSGVGKSSLINALIPDLDLQTRALSVVTGKGTHTTSTACMYYLPDNARTDRSVTDGTQFVDAAGSVIDTPGVWEYSLWHMPAAELAAGFIEFRPWLDQCRFRDCTHVDTPGCAINAAASNVDISAARYAAFTRLLAEQQRFAR